jgi:hypothetical protein
MRRRNPTFDEPWSASVALIAATEVEAAALRREMPRAVVLKTGVGLVNVRQPFPETVVSCGLAGGLRADVPTGALLLPREVQRPNGTTLMCDRKLIDALAQGALRLGLEPIFDPLLTAETIVTGEARSYWAARGFAGVDMETGRIEAARVAAVRVVLDTPGRELSPEWRRPLLALLKARNWPQAFWLAREAPRAARLAARVVAQGLGAYRT